MMLARRLGLGLVLASCLGASCSGSRAPDKKAGNNTTPKDGEKGNGSDPSELRSRVEGTGFVVEVTPPADVTVGQAAVAEVVLRPRDGYHMAIYPPKQMPEAYPPLDLTITGPPGVKLEKEALGRDDASKLEEAEIRLPVKFVAENAGEKRFAAELMFAVCVSGDQNRCNPYFEQLSWKVAAK